MRISQENTSCGTKTNAKRGATSQHARLGSKIILQHKIARRDRALDSFGGSHARTCKPCDISIMNVATVCHIVVITPGSPGRLTSRSALCFRGDQSARRSRGSVQRGPVTRRGGASGPFTERAMNEARIPDSGSQLTLCGWWRSEYFGSALRFAIARLSRTSIGLGSKGAGGGRQVKRTCKFGRPDQDRKQVKYCHARGDVRRP